jgi:hypothetical protein
MVADLITRGNQEKSRGVRRSSWEKPEARRSREEPGRTRRMEEESM